MDLTHWEFLGLVFGLALGAFGVAIEAWGVPHLKPIVGAIFVIVGAVLTVITGVLLFAFAGVTVRSPMVFPRKESRLITATPTASISNDRWHKVLDENARLKAENARLRKAGAHNITAMPLPCPAVTPLRTPSKVSVGDCDALSEVHTLLDNAYTQRGEAASDLVTRLKTPALLQQALEIFFASLVASQTIDKQAVSSLTSLQGRLCGGIATPTTDH
jgi:hypothetical protein